MDPRNAASDGRAFLVTRAYTKRVAEQAFVLGASSGASCTFVELTGLITDTHRAGVALGGAAE